MSLKMMEDEKKPFDEQEQIQLHPPLSPPKVQWTHQEEYTTFFSEVSFNKPDKASIIDELKRNGNIYYSNRESESYAEISLIDHSPNFELMRFFVEIGPLCMQLTLLNVDGRSPAHSLNNLSSTNASVYAYNPINQSSQRAVIKCLPFNSEKFDEQLIAVIKEVCFLKIAAALRVGPRITDLFGFDLIVYKQCVEFCMEICQEITQISKIQQQKLKQKLQKLHTIQIVHLDIKPQNIGFSPSLNQVIFIDFGLSRILNEGPGSMSMTTFAGSIVYCCPEMFRLYDQDYPSMVDLYFNDVHSLKQSFQQLFLRQGGEKDGFFANNEQCSNQVSSLQLKLVQQYFQLTYVKYLIFTASKELLENNAYHYLLVNKHQIILEFLRQFHISEFIEKMHAFYTQRNFLNESQNIKNTQNFIIMNYIEKKNQVIQESFRYDNFLNKLKITTATSNRRYRNAKKDNIKKLILSKELIKKTQKTVYFENFVCFTNFRTSFATLKEKNEAALILKDYLGLQIQQKSDFSLLSACMKHLLNYYCLQSQDANYDKAIPILLTNLVIIDQINEDQLIEYIKKIKNKKTKNLQCLGMMIFRCSTITEWIKAKVSSKYRIWSLIKKIYLQIMENLNLFQNTQENQNGNILKIFLKMIKYNHKENFDSESYNSIYAQLTKKMRQKSILIEPQSCRQIIIYLHYLKLRYYQTNNNFTGALQCMGEIQKQEQSIGRNVSTFQYYHFFIIRMLSKSHHFKAMNFFVSNLMAVLGSQVLFQKYTIYGQYLCMKDQLNKEMSIEFLRYILLRLKSFQDEDESQLLYYINKIIISKQKSNRDKSSLMVISEIAQQLRKIYKIGSSPEVKSIQTIIGSPYELSYYKARIMIQLYGINQEIIIYVTKMIQNLIDQYKKLKCEYCKQMAQGYINTTKCFVFHKLKQKGQIVKTYQAYTKSAYHCYNTNFVMIFLILLRWFIDQENDTQTYNQQIVEPFYEWVSSKNAWRGLFLTLSRLGDYLNEIFCYLLSHQKYDEFWQANLKIIQSISDYPLKRYIESYTSCIVFSLQIFRHKHQSILLYIKNTRILEPKDMPYIIIFSSVILIYWPIDNPYYLKILRIISKNISHVTFFARSMVRNHLLYGLLRYYIFCIQKCSIKERKSKERRLRFCYKLFLKFTINKLNWTDFSRHICNFGIIVNQRKERPQMELINFLKRYFRNVRTKQLDRKNQYYFLSPFQYVQSMKHKGLV